MAKIQESPDLAELEPLEGTAVAEGVQAPVPSVSGVYRAAWRWHFYAGLFVIPFLIILAVTGAIYLFADQLDPMFYPELRRVPLPVEGTTARPLGEQVAAVEEAFPDDRVVSVSEPLYPTRSTTVYINPKEGWEDQPADSWATGKRNVYVNPYNAEVLGSQVPDDLFMENVREVHNGLMAGTVGNRLVEIAASWTVILTVSGFYLWWRGRKARKAQRAAGRLAGRSLLRYRHARIGALGGAVLLFFIVSGLFWSGFWGDGFQRIAARSGAGYPEYAEEASTSTPRLTKDIAGGENPVPWAAEQLPVPASGAGHEGHSASGAPSAATAALVQSQPIGIDQARAVAAQRFGEAKTRHGLWISMPEDATGVYTAYSQTPGGHDGYTTLHIDQYSGQVLADYGYEDFGVLAKTVSEGVNLHLSTRFGGGADTVNTVINLLMCVAVVFMAITGPMMWWKRRPKGTLAAPRRSADKRTLRRILFVMLALGVMFPLGGATMLAVLALDGLVLRRVPRLARAFGSA
ncbi:MAG: PepSY-associated TM helix domain-containing protein [Egibacteraceae bacterium]